MPKPMNFVVVGLGMGMHHAQAIVNAKGANLYGVCDLDASRQQAALEKFGCQGYDSYKAVLADPAVDVVNIVTETGYHADMGIAAAKAGKHIVMEKPIDVTPARVKKFRDVVSQTGVKCACIFQSRVHPLNVALKKAIDKGKLGKIFGVHASLPWFRGPAYFSGPHGPWRGTWKLDGGGSMMNQGIHTVDLMLFFGGPVRRVCGFMGLHNHDLESEDQTVGCLEFESGALGTVSTTTCAVPEGAQQVYVFGEKGSFRKEGDALSMYGVGGEKEQARMLEQWGGKQGSDDAGKDPMAVPSYGHCIIVEDLVKAVRQNRDPLITIEKGQHAVEVVCAIYKAAKTGRTVDIGAIRK